MPPVQVPAIRSNSSKTRRPARRSSSVSTSAGMIPRMPPPSMARTRMAPHATTPPVRAALAMLAAAGLVGLTPDGPAAKRLERAQADANPCLGPQAQELRCPDLEMRRPYGLYPDSFTKAGHTLLRAGSVIDSTGAGPAELHGVRTGPRSMRAHQRIYRRPGGRIAVGTGASLQFKYAHQQRSWWKFYDAARFEL